MSMDFFLDRKSQMLLSEKLSAVPHLVEELAITITRQAHIQRRYMDKLRKRKPGSQIPFHVGASAAADELHNSLVTWVRHCCEERQINYTGHDDDITLSRWLRKNMIALALTQGSEEAFADLVDRIDECRRQIDLPPDDEVIIDRAQVEAANRQVLTAGQVEKIAPKLGAMGVGLNKRRVETLMRKGRLKCYAKDGDTQFFRLGEVLDAHHRYMTGTRKSAS